jgi:CheY-like chemotaxis protein
VIFADPTQIHQILMNLCTNAYHAMEDTGGTLSIALRRKLLTAEDLAGVPAVQPGDFFRLSISDTGPGIGAEIRDRIFDPYFTTKEIGKGTGMGLSIVHGIARSCGGYVSCHSQPGEGTVFHVFLPVLLQQPPPETKPIASIPVGTERILFIDDEKMLADLGRSTLQRLGYKVTVRTSSLEALTTFENQPDSFDLVITDQTMPGMTGIDLARRIQQLRPQLPIILCTGYSSLISEDQARAMGIKGFALKPVTKKDIATLIRKVLDTDGQRR